MVSATPLNSPVSSPTNLYDNDLDFLLSKKSLELEPLTIHKPRKPSPLIYFILMVVLHDPSLYIPVHRDLHRIAFPKALRSNNPHPPEIFGLEIFSNLVR